MAITTVNGGPRYTYGGPDKKTVPPMPANLGYKINSYKLPAMDVQEVRRNFDGYQVQQFFSIEEIQGGDQAGTTDTDSKTETKKMSYSGYNGDRGGYTNINRKSGGPGRNWNSSSPRRG